MSPQDEPWFAMEPDELDHALRLWERRTKQHREGLQRVQELKESHSTERLLPADPENVERCRQLKELHQQIDTLTFEKECLELELKLRIGNQAGLRNLVMWEFKASLRFSAVDLRTVHPKLYEQFRKPTMTRYFRLL